MITGRRAARNEEKARWLHGLCQRYRSSHLTSRFFQRNCSASTADSSLGYHQGQGNSPSRGGEELACCCTVESRGLFQDAHSAFDQLLVLRVEVDHQVAVNVAETSHCPG